jgi:sodium pump decarboxylase gamma subunit
MADWLVEGLTATISGVLTVFIVLIFIAFLISLLKYTDKLDVRKLFRDKKKTRVDLDKVRTQPNAVVQPKKQEDLELIAIITAAIAASLNTTTDRLIVRSIKRVNKTRRG